MSDRARAPRTTGPDDTTAPSPDTGGADRPDRTDRLAALTALAEPHRRALYEHVVRRGDWVSRDQAAEAVGLERATTAHHLDRLAADGLLEVDYRRLSGRRGPGAGRPAKVYRRARLELGVSLPPRDYELAGRLLAEAVDRATTGRVDVTDALEDVAREEGRRLAGDMRSRMPQAGRRGDREERRRAAVLAVLEQHGFEPGTAEDGTVVLRNCPFHQLAVRHRELICGMNLCLLDAAVGNVDGVGLAARLEPEEGHCCVRLHPT